MSVDTFRLRMGRARWEERAGGEVDQLLERVFVVWSRNAYAYGHGRCKLVCSPEGGPSGEQGDGDRVPLGPGVDPSSYLIIEKMIDGTNGSPDGWIASMQIAASGLFADITTSSVCPASKGTMPCEMMTSLARLPSSWQSWTLELATSTPLTRSHNGR